MKSVADGSVDFVFSGQNIEHLWPTEVSGFLLEAHRVLRAGGILVVDSPNRKVTARTRDAHPEHVIEFTVDEARGLMIAAGFDVIAVKGLWLCDNPATGERLPVSLEGSVSFRDARTRRFRSAGPILHLVDRSNPLRQASRSSARAAIDSGSPCPRMAGTPEPSAYDRRQPHNRTRWRGFVQRRL